MKLLMWSVLVILCCLCCGCAGTVSMGVTVSHGPVQGGVYWTR